MKVFFQVVFAVIMSMHIKAISQTCHIFEEQISPTTNINNINLNFHVQNNFLYYCSRPSSSGANYLYKFDIKAELLDSILLPIRIFTNENPLLDLKVNSKGQLIFLTLKKVILLRINSREIKIDFETELKPTEAIFTQIHISPISNSIYLSTNFCVNGSSRKPKIVIKKLGSSIIFEHYVKCDPFNVHPYFKLVSNNAKFEFAILEDNLDNKIFLLDSNFRKIIAFKIISYELSEQEKNAFCNAAKLNQLINTMESYDKLDSIRNISPTFEQIIYWNDSTLFAYGEDRIHDSIFPFVTKIYLNKDYNVSAKKNIPFKQPSNTIDHPFHFNSMPLNPFGKRFISSEGKLYMLDKWIDINQIKTNRDFIKVKYGNLKNRYCIYRIGPG